MMEPNLFTAPGKEDLTFGSLMSDMIRRQYEFVKSLGIAHRYYFECVHCKGTDEERPKGAVASINQVVHKDDCLLAKHLPRLTAMANRDVT